MQTPVSAAGLRLAVVAIAVALGLALSEVLLGVILEPETRFYVWPPDTRLTSYPDPAFVPGVSGPAHFAINSVGIRGDEFGPDSAEYRLLVIGGSTSELIYLDSNETWMHLVQEALGRTPDGRRVWVGSVGRSGMNARDHFVQIKYLTRQYPRIDAVLVLVGVNDLTIALSQADHYTLPTPVTEPESERRQLRRAFAVVPESVRVAGLPWYRQTALYRLLRRVAATVRTWTNRGLAQDVHGEVWERWRSHRCTATQWLDHPPDLTAALLEYRRDLEAIVTLAQARSLRIIFLTQPALWRDHLAPTEERRLWLGGVGDFQRSPGSRYYTPAALRESLRRFNEVLLDVCSTRLAECVDLVAAVPSDSTMFADDVHFSEGGARRTAAAVGEYLRHHRPWGAANADR